MSSFFSVALEIFSDKGGLASLYIDKLPRTHKTTMAVRQQVFPLAPSDENKI